MRNEDLLSELRTQEVTYVHVISPLGRIHYLGFLPRGDVSDMYPD